MVLYAYKVPYIGQATVSVNDVQNSSLQSFAAQFFGMSKSVSDGKKTNSPLLKHAEYLKTSDFFEKLLARIQASADNKNLTIAEKNGAEQFKQQFLSENLDEEAKSKVLSALDSAVHKYPITMGQG